MKEMTLEIDKLLVSIFEQKITIFIDTYQDVLGEDKYKKDLKKLENKRDEYSNQLEKETNRRDSESGSIVEQLSFSTIKQLKEHRSNLIDLRDNKDFLNKMIKIVKFLGFGMKQTLN
jgi:hypothetical protein